jgi:hypothetical protein
MQYPTRTAGGGPDKFHKSIMSNTSFSNTTLEQMLELNPALAQCNIRVHKESQQGSTIDVIRLVTGLSSAHAGQALSRLDSKLITRCDQLRINGKGKITPVADAPTLIEIIWELPGKVAKKFRRQSAHLVARYLRADRTLIDEIEARYERVPVKFQAFMQAHVKRPEESPLSDEEAARILKRKRDDLERAEIDAKLRKYAIEEQEQGFKSLELDAVHKSRMEDLGGERVLARTRLAANPEIQRLMSSDAHIQSVFNDYLKQSMILLTCDRGKDA